MAAVLGAALVCLFLAGFTIMGSHTPPWMSILFWSSLTIVVTLWWQAPRQRSARGQPFETVVEKHGVTLTPVAVIPNATKSLMVIPEHMSVLPLPLDRITEGLPHRRR